MGKSHCICHKEPCRCNNGWGEFETEDELFAEIEAEIKAEVRRLPWSTGDVQAVQWLLAEYNSTEEEIAETLGISLQNVRRIMRALLDQPVEFEDEDDEEYLEEE